MVSLVGGLEAKAAVAAAAAAVAAAAPLFSLHITTKHRHPRVIRCIL